MRLAPFASRSHAATLGSASLSCIKLEALVAGFGNRLLFLLVLVTVYFSCCVVPRHDVVHPGEHTICRDVGSLHRCSPQF